MIAGGPTYVATPHGHGSESTGPSMQCLMAASSLHTLKKLHLPKVVAVVLADVIMTNDILKRYSREIEYD